MNLENIFTSKGILKENKSEEIVGLFGYIYAPKSSSYYLKSVVINFVAQISSLSIALDIPVVKFYEDIRDINVKPKDIVFIESDKFFISIKEGVLKFSAKDRQWSIIENFIINNKAIEFVEVKNITHTELLNLYEKFNDSSTSQSKFSRENIDLQLDNILDYPNWYDQEIKDYKPKEFNIILNQKDLSNSEFLSAINLTSRLALEHNNIRQSVVNNSDDNKLNIMIKANSEATSKIEKVGKNLFEVSGLKNDIYDFTLKFSKEYPFMKNPFLLKNMTTWIKDFINLDNSVSQLVEAIKNNIKNDGKVFIELGPEDIRLSKFQEIGEKFGLEVKSRKANKQALQWEYKPVWEVSKAIDILNNLIAEKVLKNIDRVEVFVSEGKRVRENLKSKLVDLLSKNNINTKVVVYRAYKQAVSWIEEVIIPEIIDSEVKRIEIGFKPFLSSDEKWEDHYGAIPVIENSEQDKTNKYLELPTRLLQELYPIDDILEQKIGIDRDNVTFYKLSNDSTFDYKFKAFKENPIYENQFCVSFSKRQYIDGYLQSGLVHPNTGVIRCFSGESLKLERQFKTDLEEIWDFYQNNILSDTVSYLTKLDTNKIQPLFRKLTLNVIASEPERKLLSREDMISTLNGLHEDMYFVGLDYFRTWGNKTYGKSFDEPGLILPKIIAKDGASPTVKATLELEEYKVPTLVNKEKEIELLPEANISKIELLSIVKVDKGYCIKYDIKCKEGAISSVKVLERIVSSGYNIFPEWIDSISKIILKINNKNYIFNVDFSSTDGSKIESMNKSHLLEVIDFTINESLVSALDKYPQFSIFTLATSYIGRPIYAIEVNNYYNYDLSSFYKRRNLYNSLILNNRHHANEISATNAAYKLLIDIGEGKLKIDKLNLAIIPIENIDGVQIHYELMKDNPNWKLHVARYNAVGKEIANDYFNKDSIYGESHALPRLYSRYLPEVFIDNHGVPSHEWDQQFSGYVSPWFKGFWLPRAIYYGYFWYPKGNQNSKHIKFTEEIAEKISIDLNEDKEIATLNKEWKSRFLKYANKWMPNQFPANYYKNLIYYWISFKPENSQRHFAPKFPNITFIDMTTEVSDETAQGQYLQICTKALDMSNRSIINYVKNIDFTKG